MAETGCELDATATAEGVRQGGEIAAKYLEEYAAVWRGKPQPNSSAISHAEWCETYAEGIRRLTQEP